MKLHIECLQEKLEQAVRDQKLIKMKDGEIETLKQELRKFVELSKKVEADSVKMQTELKNCQTKLAQLEIEKNKLVVKLTEKEEKI